MSRLMSIAKAFRPLLSRPQNFVGRVVKPASSFAVTYKSFASHASHSAGSKDEVSCANYQEVTEENSEPATYCN